MFEFELGKMFPCEILMYFVKFHSLGDLPLPYLLEDEDYEEHFVLI
jgi:hypothetical protein